jgi:hypothetical protein
MPLILGTNSIKDTGYDVDNSLRFNSGSSDYLERTPSSEGNKKKWTWSAWIKRSKLGSEEFVFYSRASADNDTRFFFESDSFKFQNTVSNTTNVRLFTNRVFRDVNSWYNIIISYDSTVSSPDTNSIQMFVNGVKETSFSATIYPSQNQDTFVNDDALHTIGRRNDGASNYFNGYMAEVVLIDGQALDPTSFGEFDEDSGIWKPIDVSGLTFGSQGWYLDYEDSSALGNDVSGNNNDWTVNNLTAIDQTTDTPTNNYCTLNSLDKHASLTPTEGNLAVSNGAGTWMPIKSTFAMSKGKWYCEVKVTSGTDFPIAIYLSRLDGSSQSNMDSQRIYYNGSYLGGSIIVQGLFTSEQNGVGTFTTNDIISMALDCDNGTMKFYKNGSQVGTTITNSVLSSNEFMFGVQLNGDGVQFNFGNPPFTISSGNTDGNGYGNFEYAVPSGYYALNTKNLAEYG